MKGNKEKTVIAVGDFDGVHQAHARLIELTVKNAGLLGATPAVWTFDDHIKASGAKKITLTSARNAILYDAGIKKIFSRSFDRMKELSAQRYVSDELIENCGAVFAVCGYNFTFGKDKTGDASALAELMKQHGGDAAIVDEVKIDGVTVSSTAIRAALFSGDIKLANQMLGRPFFIETPVIHGRHLGTGLGFPTINQKYPELLTPLRRGVYFCRCVIGKESYRAVCNVGIKPTVGSDDVLCETHLLDHTENLYGRDVKVEFLDFLRDEKKFDSLYDLKEQIKKDTDAARRLPW